MGTILIIILVLLLLGRCRRGRTAEAGDITQAVVWDWFC